MLVLRFRHHVNRIVRLIESSARIRHYTIAFDYGRFVGHLIRSVMGGGALIVRLRVFVGIGQVARGGLIA
jgi:hypothetical protein